MSSRQKRDLVGTTALVLGVVWLLLLAGAVVTGQYTADWAPKGRGFALVVGFGTLALVAALVVRVSGEFGSSWAVLLGTLILLSTVAVGLFSYIDHANNRPFVIERLSVVLRVDEIDGTRAHLREENILAMERGGRGIFWWMGIGALDEEVKVINFNVSYSGVVVARQNLEMGQGSLYDVKTILDRPAEKGQRITRTAEFDVIANPSDEDGHTVPVDTRIHHLEIVLLMPRGRECTTAQLLVDSKVSVDEIAPELSADGLRVEWKRENPEMGREYTVICDHKPGTSEATVPLALLHY